MVSYIFIVAVLNMALGFAVAVHLGRQFRALSGVDDAEILPISEPTNDAETFGGEDEIEEGGEGDKLTVDDLEAAVTSAISGLTDSGLEAEETANRPEPPPPSMPGISSASDREKSKSERSIEAIQDEVHQYHDRLTEADDQLRSNLEEPDAAAIVSCLASLREATDEYLQGRGAATKKFEELHENRPEYETITDDVKAAMESQDQQIESTNQVIESLDCEDDLQDSCRQMVSEAAKLLDANLRVRDSLDSAIASVARLEEHLMAADAETEPEGLTGILDRTALEARLADWWQNEAQGHRQLTAAMADLDHFTQINDEHGHATGDEILRAVAQMMRTEVQGDSAVARYSGQRFFFLLPDTDIRVGTNLVERIRQTIEAAQFRRKETDVRVTISCGIAEAEADDTTETLIARIDAAIQEAKRYGRNRAFLHEGKYPTPVVPPNLSLEPRQIML